MEHSSHIALGVGVRPFAAFTYQTKASASVLIGYRQTVCKEIRAAVRQLADVCARVELLDPENTKRQEFVDVGRALQVASIQTRQSYRR